MATTTRRRKRNPRGEGERLRTALIDACGEVLLERGTADGLSIRAVTSRAGVSPTALYLHFADLDELVRAVCEDAFEELVAYLHEAAGARPSAGPLETLRAMGRAYIDFADQRPGLYRILFATPARGLVAPVEGDPGIAAFDTLVAATEGSVGKGVDAPAVAVQLWTGLHGYVSLRAVMPSVKPGLPWPDPDAFLDGLLDGHIRHARQKEQRT